MNGSGDGPARYALDRRTLDILVCPLTKTRLQLSADGTELISRAAHLAFPIKRGVPMLSLDEARQVDPDALKALPFTQGEDGEA